MTLKLVVTGDGSHSLVDESLGESYHNLNGALTESTYVFIERGLAALPPRQGTLEILEIGLGTGLNALLTALCGPTLGHPQIAMTSLEPFPLPPNIVAQLNFAQCLANHSDASAILDGIHRCESARPKKLAPGFQFTVHHCELAKFGGGPNPFDLVYFDAFAPAYQANLWQLDQLERVLTWMKPGGLLVTYCAKGQFKRDLRTAGFEVETLPGCLGKREMTRAWVPG